MSESKSNPTMKDVAREAGVALGTVSKVVNGIPVGEDYRVRVEEAIKKLNYQINSYAKGFKSGKTMTIAVVMPNLVSPYFALLTNCIQKVLAARYYQMVYYSSDYIPELEEKYIRMAERQKVDGIICLSYYPKQVLPEDLNVVFIDRYFGGKFPCVTSDNYGGGWMAAEKLVELGCKHIAILQIGSRLPHEPDKRRDGFVASCEALGVDYEQCILHDGDPYQDFVDFLQARFHDGKLDLDGIFCVTDAMVYQIRGTLREMGLSVPEDVQMIGFDGIRAFGDLDYSCSTIVQPVELIAQSCVDILLREPGTPTPSLICLPVHYEYGGTTKDAVVSGS